MTSVDARARQEAIDWAIRAQDAMFDDWEALADWLGADPRHAILYDQATIGAEQAAQALLRPAPPVLAIPAITATRAGRRPAGRLLPFALAAGLIAIVGGAVALQQGLPGSTQYAVSTAPGAHRSLTIAGAVRIDLNGDSRITLDHGDDRFARLDQGEALFTVVHNPARPFAVHVGTSTITDVGTVFNVEQGADVTRVDVAEGEVKVGGAAGAVAVSAGEVATFGKGRDAVVSRSDIARSAGAWRTGQIDFDDISLAQLAERLFRASGTRIVVSPAIGSRRVSGSIVLGADRDPTLRGLGLLLGVSVVRRRDTWVWGPLPRASSS